jgi:hypothetical protein
MSHFSVILWRERSQDDGTTDGIPDEESFVKINKEDADQGANTSKTEIQCNGEASIT